MTYLKSFVLSIIMSATLAGCASDEATSATAPAGSDTKMASTTNEEKAKCEMCGNEVPKGELVSHDGKMACKACMAAHQHG